MEQDWVAVAEVGEVPQDGTLKVRCGTDDVCLYRLESGIHATHDVCTHGAASLADGFVDGREIECPFHQGRFDIPTGKASGAPCSVDLRVFEVRLQDGRVWIRPPAASTGSGTGG